MMGNTINAYPPYWKHEAWFDEMLIEKGVILVLGYNDDIHASEIIRFEISEEGRFSFLDSYLIKSNDYYQ